MSGTVPTECLPVQNGTSPPKGRRGESATANRSWLCSVKPACSTHNLGGCGVVVRCSVSSYHSSTQLLPAVYHHTGHTVVASCIQLHSTAVPSHLRLGCLPPVCVPACSFDLDTYKGPFYLVVSFPGSYASVPLSGLRAIFLELLAFIHRP